jgi:hypothetical protein
MDIKELSLSESTNRSSIEYNDVVVSEDNNLKTIIPEVIVSNEGM